MPKVSVIVPIYNREKYIRRCIDSIINQTLKDIEIILIDDGSIDNSGSICDEYAKNDYKIKVFHQINSGPSIARNKGLEMATGEYIMFVDSDDYIKPDMLIDMIYYENDNIDLIMSAQNDLSIDFLYDREYSKNDFIKDFFYNKFGNHSFYGVWCKLYKSEIIKNNNLKFNENIIWGEDLYFNLEYIKYCNKIKTLSNNYYVYEINSHSISANFKLFFYDDTIKIYELEKTIIKDFGLANKFYYKIQELLVNKLIFLLKKAIKISDKNTAIEYMKLIRQNLNINYIKVCFLANDNKTLINFLKITKHYYKKKFSIIYFIKFKKYDKCYELIKNKLK